MYKNDDNMYKEIQMPFTYTLDQVVDTLELYRKEGKLVYCDFNGQRLSSTETPDEIYMRVVGMNKNDFKKYQEDEYKKLCERLEQDKQRAISRIPEWNRKGCEAFSKDKWKYWLKIVPIRARDLYNGMELDCVLEIQKYLKDGNFKLAKSCFFGQGHSGTSGGLTLDLIREFCTNGEEFYETMR